ncbi:MAG: CMGC/CDK protein kinase [Amphiamblys sp. WSBS2006]|nr:MAG: CMGC/CDK protein kinase [Amphiamblys sp. WSBS2006]
MTGKCPKHMLLFLSASAIVGAADEYIVDIDKSKGYDEEDYVKLGDIGSGCFGAVSKIEEKKTGKIYVLKTFVDGSEGYEHATKEINALKQLKHENIVRMAASSDIANRHKDGFVHIVLEYMPSDLDAALRSHPETKENIREILYQILNGVAHIHSKNLAHGDINIKNILIDPTKLAMKICDFGNCREGEEEETFLGKPIDGYYNDSLSIVDLVGYFYLGDCFSDWISLKMFSIDEMECFLEGQRNGVILDSSLGELYKEMKGVVSKNGLELFIQLLASERIGGCTTAAEALKHPFFTEGREQDPPTKEPKKRHLCSY